ncbi:MAG: ABC transporter ATP-binding protein [Lachnospiraceae bacterium]|nr:ABC transporter ATP-binding protein [Lachnospiraceae bacterium]
MDRERLISVNNLTKKYKFGTAVANVTFDIQRKHIYGLVGPNGAGKTTIMKMLGGLVIPSGGQIHFYDGERELSPEQARRQMSFMIETPYLRRDRTARQNLEKLRLLKNVANPQVIDDVLEIVGLSDVPKNKTVRKYSLGMRQRLGIANALMSHPQCMVLDEPINGLDPTGIVEIRELLQRLNRQDGVTILISSHILSELANLCTDYIFLHHGRIINSISGEELAKVCGSNLLINTEQNQLAQQLLSDQLGIAVLKREDGQLRIPDAVDCKKEILNVLVNNGVTLLHMSEETQDLETYYMSLIQDAD